MALSDNDLDSTGLNTLLDDFLGGIDPNPIGFSLSLSNQFVNTPNVPVKSL